MHKLLDDGNESKNYNKFTVLHPSLQNAALRFFAQQLLFIQPRLWIKDYRFTKYGRFIP